MTQSTTEFSKTEVEDTVEKTPIRVLHVDDDAGFLKTAKQCLEVQGHFRIDTASSVDEAIEKMKKEKYDAVICDYQMPGKDGLEFLKELRRKGNSIPFIIFTGKGREEVVIKALNLGADLYVNKTGDPETVYSELSHGVINVVRTRCAEQELRVQREELQMILDSMPAKIWYKDKDNRLLRVNKTFAEYMGVSKENLEGKALCDLFPPDVAQKCWEEDKEVITTGRPKTDILDRHESAQEVRWFSTGKVPCRDKDGNIIGTINFSVDITERKKAEEELLYQASLLQNVSDAVIATDLNFVIRNWNKAAERIYGWNEKETIGKTVNEVTKPEYLPHNREEMARQLLREGHWEGEVVQRHKNGNDLNVFASVSLIRDGTGNSIGVIAVNRDVTERKKAEVALQESEERFRAIVENAPFGYYRVGKDGLWQYVNPVWERMHGLSLVEVVGKSFEITQTEDSVEQAKEYVKRALAGETIVGEFSRLTGEGNVEYHSFNIQPVKRNNEIVAIEGFINDITERKKAEQSLRESEERYRELANSLPGVVFETDVQRKLAFVNQKAFEITGYTQEDFTNALHNLEFLVLEDRDRARETLMKLRSGKSTGTNEYTFVRKNGSTFPVLIRSIPIMSGNKVVGTRGFIVDITERKLAEEKYRTLVEQSLQGIVVAQGVPPRVVFANPTMIHLSGYTSEELASISMERLIHPDDRPAFFSRLRDRLEGKSATSLNEYRAIRKDGKAVWIDVSSSCVEYNGEPAVQATFIDITERKELNEQIKRTSEELSRTFDAITDFLFIVDRDYRLVRVNKKVCEVLKKKPEELVGKRCYEVVHGTDKPVPNCPHKRTLETKKATSAEINDPNLGIPLLVTNSPVFDERGEVIQCVHVAKDFTEGKKAEEALRESEKKFKDIFESVGDGLVYLDAFGRIIDVNRKAVEIFGGAKEEVLGKHFTKIGIFSLKDIPTLMRNFASVMEGKKAVIEFAITNKNGKVIPLECSASLLKSNNESMIAVVARDSSERKKTLEKLQILNEKLGVVGGLTRHDVRNRLFTVTNNIYLAKQLLLGDHKALAYLREIESACDQTTRILDFAATYESLGVEQLALVDIGKAVEEAASLFSDLQDVKVVNECHGLAVMADSLLSQLFYNMIDNSLKHGKKVSQIRIHFEEGKKELKLFYEDNGVGIPKSIKPKLFDEGFTTGKGQGYGLPLIRKMMEVYGWTIEENGKPGKGAKFVITIPKTNPNGKENYQLS